MASSTEAASQNGEKAAGGVKLEGDALKEAIKKQVSVPGRVARVDGFVVQTCTRIARHIASIASARVVNFASFAHFAIRRCIAHVS